VKEIIYIEVDKRKDDGKIIVSISGISSGFAVHTSEDSNTIKAGYDASRFDVRVKLL
jgi:hypothetical protein